MAKLLPLRRRTVRGIASCGVLLAVLLQALAFLLAERAHNAPQGDGAFATASAEFCHAAAGGGSAPPGEGQCCDLCPLCGCQRAAASLAPAPLRDATTAPLHIAADAMPALRADAMPPATVRTSSCSSRAPPRA